MAHVIDAKQVLLISIIIMGAINGYYYIRKKRFDRERIIETLFVLYLVVLVSFTLLPVLVPPMHTEDLQVNIDIRYLFNVLSDRSAIINVFGNVMLFAPISIIGYLGRYKCFKTAKYTLISSLCLTIIIEFLQGVETYFGFADFPAVIDINDIITNTIGGMFGYFIIRLYENNSINE